MRLRPAIGPLRNNTVVLPWRSASSGILAGGAWGGGEGWGGGVGLEMLGNENKAIFQPTLEKTYGASLTDDTTPLATGKRDPFQMHVKRAPPCCVSLWIAALNKSAPVTRGPAPPPPRNLHKVPGAGN